MGPPPPSPTPGGAAGGTEAPRLPPLTRGLTFSRCVVSTVVPSVTGPASAFFRLSFTSTMLSSRSTRLLSSTRHSSSISFSLCSRLARAPLSGGGRGFSWLQAMAPQLGVDHSSGSPTLRAGSCVSILQRLVHTLGEKSSALTRGHGSEV